MTTSAISIDRVAPTIGAVIDGVDLTVPLDEPTVVLLRDAVDDHHVVVVRDQFLDAEQHRRVAVNFGRLVAAPVQRLRGEMPTVSTIEDTVERPPAGFDWHTDLSWTQQPPEFGLLNAVVIPPAGGDTLWASGAAMYQRLTEAERRWCDEAVAIHAPDPSLLASVERHHGAAVAGRLRTDHAPTPHPLVRVHPRTGRPGLFLSPLYVRRLAGPAGADAASMLQRLHTLIDDPALQLRWTWRPGDFVIWDETSTVHRALTDHFPQRRVVRRCATVSDRVERGSRS